MSGQKFKRALHNYSPLTIFQPQMNTRWHIKPCDYLCNKNKAKFCIKAKRLQSAFLCPTDIIPEDLWFVQIQFAETSGLFLKKNILILFPKFDLQTSLMNRLPVCAVVTLTKYRLYWKHFKTQLFWKEIDFIYIFIYFKCWNKSFEDYKVFLFAIIIDQGSTPFNAKRAI